MALAKTITKMFPTPNKVGFRLVLTDDERPDLGTGPQVVLTRTFQGNFETGTTIKNEVRDELGKQAQQAIDNYKKLASRYAAPAYGTAITQIDNALKL